MTIHTEHRANRSLVEEHANRLRFRRSLSEAFPCEHACAVERYLSNKLTHRIGRFVRHLCRWLLAPKP